jgi:hypothetical protein
MIAVATKDKEIMMAASLRDEQMGKVEAERATRIKTAEANSLAVMGENQAKIQIAQSKAERREKEAEALKKAMAAEKVQAAKSLEEACLAEQRAEQARANKEHASQNANVVVSAGLQEQKAIKTIMTKAPGTDIIVNQ